MSARHPWKTYVKAAFKNAYNLGALTLFGGLGLIFINTTGLGIWLLAAGLELAYLYMMSTNPRFQRHVDSKLTQAAALDHKAMRQRLWKMIDPQLQQRYRDLEKQAARLDSEDISSVQRRDPFFQENRGKLATLLITYQRITVALTRYKQYLSSTEPDAIKLNIERLEKELPEASERVKGVKLKNIEILHKRLEKVEKAKTNSEYLFAQMETIEDTMRLVIDQAITLSDPKGMGLQIDNLLGNLQETELISAEMEAFSELDEGLTAEIYSHSELEAVQRYHELDD